jgi:ABC-type transporter Mla subunit MlaD
MATRANYVKVGLLVVLGSAAAVALAVLVGAATIHKKTIAYITYFNEAVTGLDVGAPVKARGVNVGRVGDIAFAPDHKMVAVRMDLETEALDRFGGSQALLTIHPNLRSQLASQGLTGSRFVAIDFFDPTAEPPPALSFPPPDRYIAAAKSQQKTIEDSVTKAMDGLANLVDTMSREGFSEKTVDAMSSVNKVLTTMDQLVTDFNRQGLPQHIAGTIERLRVAVGKVDRALDRVDGDAGLIAATQRSVSSFAEVGRNATGATRDLDQTLGEIREAAAAIRLLASELEREPDALLKGREKANAP